MRLPMCAHLQRPRWKLPWAGPFCITSFDQVFPMASLSGCHAAGKLCWMWMAATAGAALFKICLGRGHAALAELLGPSVHGTAGSDRWTAYGIIDLFRRQLCWAHPKRDFQKWVDFVLPYPTFGLTSFLMLR